MFKMISLPWTKSWPADVFTLQALSPWTKTIVIESRFFDAIREISRTTEIKYWYGNQPMELTGKAMKMSQEIVEGELTDKDNTV